MASIISKRTIYDERMDSLLQETRDLVTNNSMGPKTPADDEISLNIIKIFVHLFSDGSSDNWLKLQKFLQFLVDQKVTFTDLSEQLEHYTYRLLFQLEFSASEIQSKSFLNELKIKVHKIFPKFAFVKLMSADAFVDYEYKRGDKRKYINIATDTEDDKLTMKVDAFNKYGGSDMYDPSEVKIREKLFKQKTGLLLRDFDTLIPAIALDIASEETQNVTQLETIQNSLFGVKLIQGQSETQRSTSRPQDMDLYKMPKELNNKTRALPPIGKPKHAPEYHLPSPKKDDKSGTTYTEHLMKANHLKIAKFVYLKASNPEEPYHLEMVSRPPKNEEHYLMSNFGILRVQEDGFVESMSLADWHREAVIYKALRSLDFFKNFKVRKCLKQWKRGSNLTKMGKVLVFLEERLLLATPAFNVAFCHLQKLLIELDTVGIVPIIESGDPLTLSELEDIIVTKKMFLQKVLKKFYDYASIIVHTTRDKILEKMDLCEQKINTKPKPHVKASLSHQKAVVEENQRKLLIARREALQLGNFVQLFERYVAEYLVAFTRRELRNFTAKIMELYSHRNDTAKDKVNLKAYLSVDLTFDTECRPVVDPPIQQVALRMGNSVTAFIESITELTSPFGATVNPMLDEGRGVKPRRGFNHTFGSSSQPGSTVINLRRPSGSLDRDLEDLATMSRSQMSEALLNLSTGCGLEIIADGFVGQFEVLTKPDLQTKLESDEVVHKVKEDMFEMWADSTESVEEYCSECKWVVPICEFIKLIDSKDILSFLQKDLAEIQGILNQTRSWIEQLEAKMDIDWTSSNLLVRIKQDTVHVYMIPRLNEFIEEIARLLSERAIGICSELIRQADTMAEFFKMTSNMGIAVFASYLSEVNRSKIQLTEAKPKLDHANACLNTIKSCVRALKEEETNAIKDAELKIAQSQQHQMNAAEFVRKKRVEMEVLVRDEFDKKLQMVQQLLQQCKSDQYTKVDRESSCEMSQATKNVKELDSIREHCLYIVKQGAAEAKYLQIIRSEDKDKEGLTNAGELWSMYKKIEARRDLWKFLQVVDSMTKEWKDFKFRLLKTHKMRSKISQWKEAIEGFREHLPENDPVLEQVLSKIDQVSQLVPTIEFIQKACKNGKVWREAVQQATGEEDILDLQTLNELINVSLTGDNLKLLQVG